MSGNESGPVPADDQEEAGFPWPPPPGASILEGLARTWRESVFSPARFFRALPRGAPAGPAILYYLGVGVATAAANLFWRSLFLLIRAEPPRASPLFEALGGGEAPLVEFLLAPAFLLLELVLATAVVHAALRLFGGGAGGIGATLRVLCFAYSPRLFAVFPLVGGVVGYVWMLVVAVIGLREVHRTETWRAALAVGLPLLVVLIALLLVTALAVLAGALLA